MSDYYKVLYKSTSLVNLSVTTHKKQRSSTAVCWLCWLCRVATSARFNVSQFKLSILPDTTINWLKIFFSAETNERVNENYAVSFNACAAFEWKVKKLLLGIPQAALFSYTFISRLRIKTNSAKNCDAIWTLLQDNYLTVFCLLKWSDIALNMIIYLR